MKCLRDYQNIGRIRVDIGGIQKPFWIEPDQYKIFTMLKKKNHRYRGGWNQWKTDLKVVYDLEKWGQKDHSDCI